MSLKKLSIALAALAMSGGVAAAAVTTSPLNLRSGPGPEHPVIAVMPDKASVEILGCSGSWCRVNYDGRVGYASGSYLVDGARAAPIDRAYGYGAYGAEPYGYDGYAYEGYRPYAYSRGPFVEFGGPSVGFGFSVDRSDWPGPWGW
jgi:uncharacterized protein YraI